jgi:hypothetical protein
MATTQQAAQFNSLANYITGKNADGSPQYASDTPEDLKILSDGWSFNDVSTDPSTGQKTVVFINSGNQDYYTIYLKADGSLISYDTTYDAGGGYQQSWTASDGSHGENDKSADGSTLTSRTNSDGSSTTSTYNASTGVYGYDVVNADGSSIAYQTTYDAGGGSQQSWTASDGSHGENDKADDGSTLTNRTNADGSSTTSTYNASTGVYGYDVVNADGSSIAYQTTYDAGGGYQQSWTASDGSHGENDKSADGSTLTSRTNADGSSTTSTYNASTGVYGYNVVNSDGSSIDYQTTYDAGGGYQQSWTASDGSHGENDKSADGSTLTSRTNADGSSTTSTYNATTGVYGYGVVNADGSSINYQTTYDAGGGYQQSWTVSDGSHGENDKADDGSTLNSRTNVDGSSTTSTYNASTGVYGYDVVNADGSSIDYQTKYDAGGGYQQSWTASDSSHGENDKADDGSTLNSRTNVDGSSTTSTYNASTGVYGYDVVNADGSSIAYRTTYDAGGGYKQSWTASDGSHGENDKADDGSTLTSRTNADGSSTTSTYNASTGVYGYDVVNADGSSIAYQTTYDAGGGYQQSWTSSDGSHGENDKADDGSTLNSRTNADGSSTTSTYNASTGVYGYDVVNADGSSIDYQTKYDAGGGYQQSWTASDGSHGENDKSDDGSTLNSRTNADGSSIMDTYDASMNGYDHYVYDVEGNFTDNYSYQTYNNGKLNTVSGVYSGDSAGNWNDDHKIFDTDGLLVGEGVSSGDATGASTEDYKELNTNGLPTREVISKNDAEGNTIYQITYQTSYDDEGGYQQTWSATDGSYGENDKYDDSSTSISKINADGSSTTSSYDASSNSYDYYVGNADGTYTDDYRQMNPNGTLAIEDISSVNITGDWREDYKVFNDDGSIQYEQITNTTFDGQTTVNISGQGDELEIDGVKINISEGASATVNGNNNDINFSNDESISETKLSIAGNNNTVTVGNNDILTISGMGANLILGDNTDVTINTSMEIPDGGQKSIYVSNFGINDTVNITCYDYDGSNIVETIQITTDSIGTIVGDNKYLNDDGTLASEIIIITSADGNTCKTTNLDGNGNLLSTDELTKTSTGAQTDDHKIFNHNGTLASETITHQETTEIYNYDTTVFNENGVLQNEDIFTRDSTGYEEDYKVFNDDGSLAKETITNRIYESNTTSIINLDGNGNIISTKVSKWDSSTWIATDETVKYNTDGTIQYHEIHTRLPYNNRDYYALDTYYISGQGDVLDLNSAGIWDATIYIDAGASVTINGSGNKVIADAGSSVTLNGRNYDVTLNNATLTINDIEGSVYPDLVDTKAVGINATNSSITIVNKEITSETIAGSGNTVFIKDNNGALNYLTDATVYVSGLSNSIVGDNLFIEFGNGYESNYVYGNGVSINSAYYSTSSTWNNSNASSNTKSSATIGEAAQFNALAYYITGKNEDGSPIYKDGTPEYMKSLPQGWSFFDEYSSEGSGQTDVTFVNNDKKVAYIAARGTTADMDDIAADWDIIWRQTPSEVNSDALEYYYLILNNAALSDYVIQGGGHSLGGEEMAYVSSITNIVVLIENAPNTNGTTGGFFGDSHVYQINQEHDWVGHWGPNYSNAITIDDGAWLLNQFGSNGTHSILNVNSWINENGVLSNLYLDSLDPNVIAYAGVENLIWNGAACHNSDDPAIISTSEDGLVTTYTYKDGSSRIISLRDYDSGDLIGIAEKDKNGYVTNVTYLTTWGIIYSREFQMDVSGNMIRSDEWSFWYDTSNGNIFQSQETIRDGNGNITSSMTCNYSYDENGNLLSGDPIILNLQGEAVQTTALTDSNTYFDMQNNGNKVHTGWVTAEEGLLIYDSDNSNDVTQYSDLVSGFDELNSLDTNADGVLNANDAAWNQLKVWVDETGDGDSQNDQLYNMDQLDISSINLNAVHVNQDSHGNVILDNSTFTYNNCATGDIAGVEFLFNPNEVQGQVNSQLNNLIAAMAAFSSEGADESQAYLAVQSALEQFLAAASS